MDMAGKYVDGFVVPVRRDRIGEYKAFSEKFGKLWMSQGALQYIECVAEDVEPGKLTSFPQAVMLKDDEVVVFAWIVYASRAERDRVQKAVMSDPLVKCGDPKDVPFDGKRMIFGGFDVLVAF